jgi:transglutaminase-like putative cysteine protease
VRYLIEHESSLRFPQPVREHHCELRLAPHYGAAVAVRDCAIEVEPAAPLREHADCFGNRVHRFDLMAPHEEVTVRLRAEVETLLENPFDYAPLPPSAERAYVERRLRAEPALHDFLLHRSPAVPDLDALAAAAPPAYEEAATLFENLQALTRWAAAEFRYDPAATDVHAPLARLLEVRAGVCQDFAHFVVATVRGWGFPARYVAGYLDPGAGDATERPQTTHAWAEVLIPGAGWRGFDATHGLVADALYVPVAVGRDSFDAAPIRGTFKGAECGEVPAVRLRVARQEQ